MERLKTATGTSELDDASAAGRAAAQAAMAGLGGVEPCLVLVYASVRYDLEQLLAGIRAVTGDAPLAGSTSSGHFAGDVVAGPGQGVAVLVLGGGDYRFGVASATGMSTDPEGVGIAVARGAKAAATAVLHVPQARSGAEAETAAGPGSEPAVGSGAEPGAGERPYAAVILMTDGLGGDQQAVLSGVHRVCGAAVPVVGGAASDDRKLRRTSVFHDDRAFSDGAVAIYVSSRRPLTVASAHGWRAITLPLLITRSEGTVIHEIGGRSAMEVYSELAQSEPAERDLLRPSASGGPVWQASYALGLIEPDGSHLVRGVYLTRSGPINAFTPLPAYSAVQVMTADPETLLAVVDGVIDEALVYGDESVVLAFSCIARMDILGDAFPDEVARMTKAAGEAVCFGAYTYGEFARAKGVGGVHNATLTTLAL